MSIDLAAVSIFVISIYILIGSSLIYALDIYSMKIVRYLDSKRNNERSTD
jgi:hypothetical protein